jgi:anti-sigma28 factor (negative regulator of flagellin synthesis)
VGLKMGETKIISYRQWRNSIVKEGYSDQHQVGDESLQRVYKLANTIKLEGHAMNFQQEVRLTMVKFNKKQNGKNEIKLIQSLIKMCKNEKIFRKNRVEELKQQIKAKKYIVSGEEVVNKWFPEDSAT